MLIKLKNLLIKENNLSEAESMEVTKWLDEQFNIEHDSEEDLQYYIDNIRLFSNIQEALFYELNDLSKYTFVQILTNSEIEEKDVGLTLAQAYLRDSDYIKIKGSDKYFYFYE